MVKIPGDGEGVGARVGGSVAHGVLLADGRRVAISEAAPQWTRFPACVILRPATERPGWGRGDHPFFFTLDTSGLDGDGSRPRAGDGVLYGKGGSYVERA